MKKTIVRRDVSTNLFDSNLPPLLQRIYSARGIASAYELERGLEHLYPYHSLSNMEQALPCLIEAMELSQHIMIIGDFDTDGATSTAVAVKCLMGLGANRISYLV